MPKPTKGLKEWTLNANDRCDVCSAQAYVRPTGSTGDLLFCANILLDYSKDYNKDIWNDIITLLPEGYKQKRLVTLNYETLITMYQQRKGHKLEEWETFLLRMCRECPYLLHFTQNL